MQERLSHILRPYKELIFQLVLQSLLFTFYSFDKNDPRFEYVHLIFFFNNALAAFVINYFLLGKFFYTKRYLEFFFFTSLLVLYVILSEELVLEQIYYPDTKGQSFPGVFFTLLEVLPVIVILVGFKFAWDAIAKQKEVDSLKEAMRDSELQFLTSQINPHFLFNNLNNLYAYAIEASPKTPDIILELSSVLRYMLYECKAKFVPLKKELEHLENFTHLSQLQIEERGKVNFQCSEIPTSFMIAPLILIVFIENAFKHSQASQTEDIDIDIKIDVSPAGQLEFSCSNNFLPISNTENLSKGIGLKNVRKRLELLYPNDYELVIEEDETRFDVFLSLNLHQTELA